MYRARFLRTAAAASVVISALVALSLGLAACGGGGSASDATASGVTAAAQNGESKDLAPSFSGPTLDGKQVSLEQYRGKPLILVFMTYT